MPPWGWLAAIVGVSFLLRAWLARGMVGPFIMVDELIYSELARSFAADGAFQVRDAPAAGFSLVYPVLISPAYLFVDALPTAYAVVKTLNAAFMSLAAIPAYLLARRMLAPPLSLVAAVLTVAVPVDGLHGHGDDRERLLPAVPDGRRSRSCSCSRSRRSRGRSVLFVLVGLCFATRAQAVAFIPAILLAPAAARRARQAGRRAT